MDVTCSAHSQIVPLANAGNTGLRYKLEVSENYTNDHVTVQIAIESTRLTPEQITEMVGASCDEARRIGEPRGHAGKTWDCNVWLILNRRRGSDYPGRSAHDLLPICIKEFLDRVRGISDGLREVVLTEGGGFGIHVTATSVPGLSFEPETIHLIAELGLSLDVDIVLISAEEDQTR
jgi:hypothetical protein